MPSLMELRTAIIETIKAEFKGVFNEVEPHSGMFSPADINKVSSTAPSVFIACLGMGQPQNAVTGQARVKAKFVAYIVANDGAYIKNKNNQDVLFLVNTLASFIVNSKFGLKILPLLKAPIADNLLNGKLKSKKLTIWALRWEMEVNIGEYSRDALGNDGDGTLLEPVELTGATNG